MVEREGHRHGDDSAPPYFSREVVSRGQAGWSLPPLSGDQRLVSSCWNLTVGKGTAVSSALIETSSFAPMALFGLGL
jgi:hypothetical protein